MFLAPFFLGEAGGRDVGISWGGSGGAGAAGGGGELKQITAFLLASHFVG